MITDTAKEPEGFDILNFRAGDQKAFAFVFEHNFNVLHSYYAGIVNTDAAKSEIILNSVAMEDIVKLAFEKLKSNQTGMQCYDHIVRWLHVIVRNDTIDFMRAKRTRALSEVGGGSHN